ncbi:hypothetical protein IB286_11580 [Spongiibacter sp. KMU-158]|uniref:Uncharacterized protein n=1 Tax=Spongiibacter pelagi TaxID=2760804 RepID=A0A927C582_9GAMM|nr:hypothetical protein [Spongiibacter pelagi]MBD2859645.1 hypothetical protein [Spongiibacter pelagi]
MLIASYLVGYNSDMSVGHLGVDRVFPEDISGARCELRETGLGRNAEYDLLIFFPKGDMPQNLVCLPELPDDVVECFLKGRVLPVLDFASGQSMESAAVFRDRDCA